MSMMTQSPFKPKIKKEYSTEELGYSNNTVQSKYQNEDFGEGGCNCLLNPVADNSSQLDEKSFFQEVSSNKRNSREYNSNKISNDLKLLNESKQPEEYQTQLYNLEQKIIILKNDLQDQTIKNSELEKKLHELQIADNKLDNVLSNNVENVKKIHQLDILLKEARKQNLIYSDEIKEFRKQEFNLNKANEEIDYLKHENMTLKAFIVAKNKMTHYRQAFGSLKIENYCPRCSESIQDEYAKSSEYDLSIKNKNLEMDILVPDSNNDGHRDVVEILKTSSSYTIQLDNNGNNAEIVDTRNSKSPKEVVPSINKQALRQMTDRIDVALDSLDVLVRTMIHLGDQVHVRLHWDTDKPCKATVKYIGKLDERYQHRLYLGVKLYMKMNEIPQDCRNNGWLRNRQYFSINSYNGYFLHFSNVTAIYNKETAQFEDFVDYIHRKIDPKANRNRARTNSIKGLIEK